MFGLAPLLWAFALFLVTCCVSKTSFADAISQPIPQRVVSLSPAVTEIIYELGAQDRLVGATDFCNFPPEATKIPRVGGVVNPNFEVMVALKPDLIIHQDDNFNLDKHARTLGIKSLPVKLIDLESIQKAILVIGEALGKEEEAQKLRQRIQDGLLFYKNKLEGQKRKSVFFIFDDNRNSLRDLFAVGKGTFLDQLLTVAGGDNILTDSFVPYPKVSKEYVVHTSPEVIIELHPEADDSEVYKRQSKLDWQRFPTVAAVKNGDIQFINDGFMVIPGPRVLEIVDRLAKAVHPELFEDSHLQLSSPESQKQ